MARRLWLLIPAIIVVVGVSAAVGALVATRSGSDETTVSATITTAATTTTTTTPPTTEAPTTAPPTTAPPTTAPPSPPTTAAPPPALVDCQVVKDDYFAKYRAVYGSAPRNQDLVAYFTFTSRPDCIDPSWRLPSLDQIGSSPIPRDCRLCG